MARYHVNDRGNVRTCRARIRCPFGSDENHYASKAEARQSYEEAQGQAFQRTMPALENLVPLDPCHRDVLGRGKSVATCNYSDSKLEQAYLTGLCHHLAAYYHYSNPDRFQIWVAEFPKKDSLRPNGGYSNYGDGGHFFVLDTRMNTYIDVQGVHEDRDAILQHPELNSFLTDAYVSEFYQPGEVGSLTGSFELYGGFHKAWATDACYTIERLNLPKPN